MTSVNRPEAGTTKSRTADTEQLAGQGGSGLRRGSSEVIAENLRRPVGPADLVHQLAELNRHQRGGPLAAAGEEVAAAQEPDAGEEFAQVGAGFSDRVIALVCVHGAEITKAA